MHKFNNIGWYFVWMKIEFEEDLDKNTYQLFFKDMFLCLQFMNGVMAHLFLGFSLYGAKLITKKLILSDIHSPLKDSIRRTIDYNKIDDIKVSFYIIDKVSKVNENNIDLFVSNPSHFFSLSKVKETYPNEKIYSRLILDKDWSIHRDLFENIGSKVSENGVPLMQEN